MPWKSSEPEYPTPPNSWLKYAGVYVVGSVFRSVNLHSAMIHGWLPGAIGPMRLADFGIEGDGTQNLLWRVRNGELASRPSAAVVLVGIDNLLHGDGPADTALGIQAVVNAIRVARSSSSRSPTAR